MITLIAAIGRNNEIGLRNKLPWKIPEDMKHFKTYTMGKVIAMGSNTFASIGNKPLSGRKCIVVSSNGVAGMAIRAKSVDDLLSVDHCYPEIVVIGGESIYKQTIDKADKLVITHIDADFEADTFFPKIDPAVWMISKSVCGNDETYKYMFVEYILRENNRNID